VAEALPRVISDTDRGMISGIRHPQDDILDLVELLMEDAFHAELEEDTQSTFLEPAVTLLRLRSALRFDFDQDAATQAHPASHLTIAHQDCRIAVFAPLSVGHFVRFVFRNFYPHAWKDHAFLRDWPLHQFNRCIHTDHRNELFIECHTPAEI
jgi:hypothetical protein